MGNLRRVIADMMALYFLDTLNAICFIFFIADEFLSEGYLNYLDLPAIISNISYCVQRLLHGSLRIDA